MSHRFTSLSKIFLAALVVAFVVSALGATAAVAAPREVSPFGMNSHMLWGYSTDSIDREMDSLQAAGTAWLRIDVSWYGFEPTTKGVYDTALLAKFDYIVAQAAAHGMQVAPVVLATPKWANDGISRWNPPTNDADFGDFMKFMAARYAGRVTYWELGNEVNETGFWNVPRASSPARYVSFLKAGYAGTKAGNPSAKVITAGLAGADFGYIDEMYRAGAKGNFDIIGIHPYGGGSPYTERPDYPGRCYSGMARVKQVMDANGDAAKTIWATELGWETGTSSGSYTEAQQSTYTYEAFKRLYEEFPYVTTIFIYGLRNQGTDLNSPIDNYGLLRKDFSAKPAFASYRKAFDAFQAATVTPAPAPAPVPTQTVDATPVATAPSQTIVLTSSTTTIRIGRSAKLSVNVAPAAAVQVRLQSRPVGATSWTPVKMLTTGSTGAVTTSVKVSATTEYRVVNADESVSSAVVRITATR